jgi:hypothetical protein
MIEDRLDRHGKHGKESGTHPEPNNETVKKRKLRASGRTPVQKAWRDDRQKAMKIMKEIFPSQQDYDLVLNQLSDSIQKGKSVAPKAWAVTLFPDGFRLNVGQVEVLTAFQDEIRLLVQGADRSIDTKLLKQSPYKVSGDNYIFSGRMEQFRRYRRALISPHHDFVIAAGTTQTGKPRAGTPHRASHSSGLADLAEAVAPMGVEKTRRIHWVESNELDDLGHGVQFLHDDLQSRYPVAFLEGYDWSHGGSATVRLLGICPPSITADHWSEIIKSAREAVVAFLSQEGNVNWGFRHEQVYVSANA